VSAESIVYGWLSGFAGLTALVGTRIYPDVIPEQASLPAIAFTRSQTEPVSTIHGSVFAEFVAVQIQAWSATRTEAEAVADAVVDALAANAEIYIARGALFDEETGYFGTHVDVSVLVNAP
jgi:hypothetical protein